MSTKGTQADKDMVKWLAYLYLMIICNRVKMMISYLSLIGSILIFCVGLNLVWGKTLRVANMLPAVLLAVIAAYLPWTF